MAFFRNTKMVFLSAKSGKMDECLAMKDFDKTEMLLPTYERVREKVSCGSNNKVVVVVVGCPLNRPFQPSSSSSSSRFEQMMKGTKKKHFLGELNVRRFLQ